MASQPELAPRTAAEDDVVARLVQLVQELRERNEQLQFALDSRIVIEQAKGVLAERLDVGPDDAFSLLRRAARNHRTNIHRLAAAVVGSRQTPLEIEAVLAALRAEGSANGTRLA